MQGTSKTINNKKKEKQTQIKKKKYIPFYPLDNTTHKISESVTRNKEKATTEPTSNLLIFQKIPGSAEEPKSTVWAQTA